MIDTGDLNGLAISPKLVSSRKIANLEPLPCPLPAG